MRSLVLFASVLLGALLGSACADEAPRPTTPRPSAVPESSDDPASKTTVAGGGTKTRGGVGTTPDAQPTDGGAGVPSGLDMRVGGAGGAAGTSPGAVSGSGRSLAEAGPGSSDPRTLPPPWIGGARAKVVIEEFSNFECPYCQAGAKTMKRVIEHYGTKVKVIYRHLPLAYQSQAKLAAQAAVCAQAQGKFWPMKVMLFEHHDALSRADLLGYARKLGLDVPRFTRDLDGGACLPRVEADIGEAKRRVIEGTPAYFINGTKHEGALPFEDFRKLIDAALAN